jgi:hypothetical protein
MYNLISLQNSSDVKNTLRQLRELFSLNYSQHYARLIAEAFKNVAGNELNNPHNHSANFFANTLSQLNKAAIASKLKGIYAGPGFDEEEIYLHAWQGLASSGLSAEAYLKSITGATLPAEEYADAEAYLAILKIRQRTLKEVNFMALELNKEIVGFVIYHVFEIDNQITFQVRQAVISDKHMNELVDELVDMFPRATIEVNKNNINTMPVMNALQKAQLAMEHTAILSYNPKLLSQSNSYNLLLFKACGADRITCILHANDGAETQQRPGISVR